MSENKGNTERIPKITDDMIKDHNKKKSNTIKPKKLTNNIKEKKETKEDKVEVEKKSSSFNPFLAILLVVAICIVVFLILINRDNNRRDKDYLMQRNDKLEQEIEGYKGMKTLPSQEELAETNATLEEENRKLAEEKAEIREELDDTKDKLRESQLREEELKMKSNTAVSQEDYNYIKEQYDKASSESSDLRSKLSEVNRELSDLRNSSITQEDLDIRDRNIQNLKEELFQKEQEIERLRALSDN